MPNRLYRLQSENGFETTSDEDGSGEESDPDKVMDLEDLGDVVTKISAAKVRAKLVMAFVVK